VCDQVERLFREDLAAVAHKQAHSHAPTHADQTALVTERGSGQAAPSRLFVGQTALPELLIGDPVKMVYMEVFIAFALSMPKHRSLQAFQFVERDAADSPAGGQLAAGCVDCFLVAQRQVQRGLRFSGNSGG